MSGTLCDGARKSSLVASIDLRTRVLLLGSLPGERSLEAGEYYAHPSNAFWWLVGEVLGESDLADMAYVERLACLRTHGIGLWDVIASARRPGSLDSSIRDATHRDLVAFSAALPQLRAIGFNGATAAKRGRQQFVGQDGRIVLIDLPSSSAAHASLSRSAKLSAWRVIEHYLS